MEFQSFLKFDDLEYDSLSPIMREYYEIKKEYKDFIVLFRAGEFFETYFEDAVLFSNITGVSLTKKKFKIGNVLMSGIPHKKVDFYIEKIVTENHKLVIADQIKEDNTYKRKVTRTYTKGTLLELELLNSKQNNYLASLYKTDDVTYEFCYSDISTGGVYISRGNVDEIRCELARISPSELLIPKNNVIKEEIYLPYKYEFLDKNFYDTDNKNPSYIGLIRYVEYILKNQLPKLDELIQYKIQKNLLMNFNVRKNLELTKNSYNNKKQGSLLWALDYCKTPMGKRLLSSFVSTPTIDIVEIKKRQNAIHKYLENPESADKLGQLLENLCDISRLSSRLSNETITPFEFLSLKGGLKILGDIEKIKNSFNLEFFNEIQSDTKLLLDYAEILDKTIEDDVEKIKSGDYIKSGADSNFDILVFEYKKALGDIEQYGDKLRAYTNIDSLAVIKKNGRYLIEISNSSINPKGADFRLVQKLKSTTRYTTDELISLEEKVFSCIAKIDETRKMIFENLRKYSKEMTDNVRKYSKTLALLDVFYSLYFAAKEYNLVCPNFTTDGSFNIKESQHLAAKKIIGGFESLDIEFGDKNFVILTGQNGIGKSTLLKQIGITIIMAQMGCFIPCKTAQIPLVDKLFAVLNVGDELINKKSMHQAQMKEIAEITKNITNKSVVLLDEIGKSTSYKEGVSISYALIKYFLEETSAKTVFATHYLNLKELTKEYENKISYAQILLKNGKRALVEGIIEKSSGITVAKNENMPEKIIQYAEEAMQFV